MFEVSLAVSSKVRQPWGVVCSMHNSIVEDFIFGNLAGGNDKNPSCQMLTFTHNQISGPCSSLLVA